MRKYAPKSIVVFIIAFYLSVFSLLPFFIDNTLASDKKCTFIVHSYEDGHICGQPQHDGVIKALEENGWVVGKNIELAMYHMDTKKKNNTNELIEQQGRIALEKIAQAKPDIVLTLDDNAFRTVGLALSGKPVAVVFSGMNVQPEVYNQKTAFMQTRLHPRGNISGVYTASNLDIDITNHQTDLNESDHERLFDNDPIHGFMLTYVFPI